VWHVNRQVTSKSCARTANSSQLTVPTKTTPSFISCMLVTDESTLADLTATSSGRVGVASRVLSGLLHEPRPISRAFCFTSSTTPSPEPTNMVPSATRYNAVMPLLYSSTAVAAEVRRLLLPAGGYLAKHPTSVGALVGVTTAVSAEKFSLIFITSPVLVPQYAYSSSRSMTVHKILRLILANEPSSPWMFRCSLLSVHSLSMLSPATTKHSPRLCTGLSTVAEPAVDLTDEDPHSTSRLPMS